MLVGAYLRESNIGSKNINGNPSAAKVKRAMVFLSSVSTLSSLAALSSVVTPKMKIMAPRMIKVVVIGAEIRYRDTDQHTGSDDDPNPFAPGNDECDDQYPHDCPGEHQVEDLK